MRDSRTIQVLAGAVTVTAIAAAYLSIHGGSPPAVNPKPHAAAGTVLAQQAVTLLKPGGKIIIIARDTAHFKNPATDIQLAALKKTLTAARAPMGAVQFVQADPLRPVELPPGDFLVLIRNAPPGSVVVSLVGPPVLSEAQRKQAGDTKAAVVAFCSGPEPDLVDLKSLFEQGLLQAAVVTRRNPRPEGQSGNQWFDQHFLAITPANLTSLASR